MREAAIVATARTPIGKLGSTLVPFLVAVLVALAVAVYVLARR